MIYTLQYEFIDELYDDIIIFHENYEYYIEEVLQDIIEYKYEKQFHKKYNAALWRLDNDEVEFIKNIESKWWKNELDTFALYHENDFLDWLKDKYYDIAINKLYLDIMEDFYALGEENLYE